MGLLTDLLGDGNATSLPLRAKTGRIYVPDGAPTTVTATLDVCTWMPMFLPVGTTFDRIGFEVTTAAGAGGVARVAIAKDVDGEPSALLYQSPSAIDTTTTGIKEATISVTSTTGIVHVLFVAQVAAATVRAKTPNGGVGGHLTATTELNRPGGLGYATGVSGAIPDPFVPNGAAATTAPLVYLRAA